MWRKVANMLSRLSCIGFAYRNFRNPRVIFKLVTAASQQGAYEVDLKNGARLLLRPSFGAAVSDVDILVENVNQDQYRIGELVAAGDTVVDIGAQIGLFSIMAARCTGAGPVYAFEPEHANFQLLRRNADLNSALNIHAFNMAVTSHGRPVQLCVTQANTGGHTLLAQGDDYQTISSLTLREIVTDIAKGRINLLKLDCEGSEYDILLNASFEDLQQIDQIIMEVHDTPYTALYSVEELFGHLNNNGFTTEVLRTMRYNAEGTFYIARAFRHG